LIFINPDNRIKQKPTPLLGLFLWWRMDAFPDACRGRTRALFQVWYSGHGRATKDSLYISEANMPMIFQRYMPREHGTLPTPFRAWRRCCRTHAQAAYGGAAAMSL